MNDCYKVGLERKPDLDGRLAIKFRVDPAGKVSGVAPADATVTDQGTTECIVQVIKGLELPKNPGPLVSVLVPLELTTTTLPPPPGAQRASCRERGCRHASKLAPSPPPSPASSEH